MTKEKKYKLVLFQVIRNNTVMPKLMESGGSMEMLEKTTVETLEYVINKVTTGLDDASKDRLYELAAVGTIYGLIEREGTKLGKTSDEIYDMARQTVDKMVLELNLNKVDKLYKQGYNQLHCVS